MTSNVIALDEMSPSASVARAIRVELARLDRNQSWLANKLGRNNTWVSARISRKNSRTVDLTVDEIAQIAEALGVSAQRLALAAFTSVEGGDLLPRLDSNQQPSDYPYAQVIDLSRWRSAKVVA